MANGEDKRWDMIIRAGTGIASIVATVALSAGAWFFLELNGGVKDLRLEIRELRETVREFRVRNEFWASGMNDLKKRVDALEGKRNGRPDGER